MQSGRAAPVFNKKNMPESELRHTDSDTEVNKEHYSTGGSSVGMNKLSTGPNYSMINGLEDSSNVSGAVSNLDSSVSSNYGVLTGTG